ncbi:MAG TPA: hypothetical protein VFE24_03360 [Pirellulales bacterium]|jgi:general secretion pathway protein D|nr:hypothetical protein [Pirellulales bacterium]
MMLGTELALAQAPKTAPAFRAPKLSAVPARPVPNPPMAEGVAPGAEEVPPPSNAAGPAIAPAQLAAPPGTAPLELIEFRDIPLDEALRSLSDQSGLKIVPSAEAAKVHVSLYLRDVQPTVALDALTKANGLYYKQDRANGIIRIYTTKEYENDLGSFREERTEVFTLLYPNPVDVAYAIRGLFGTRVQFSLGADDQLAYDDLSQRFNRFDLVDARNQGLGSEGGGGFGRSNSTGNGFTGSGIGGTGSSSFGRSGILGGSLAGGTGITSLNGLGSQFGQNEFNAPQNQQPQGATKLDNLTPDQIQQLEKARNSAAPEDQQAIDELLRSRRARIYVTVIRRNNQVVVRTSDDQIMNRIRELICNLDVPTPLVLLEVKVMSIQLDDDFSSVFDYQFTDAHTVAGSFTAGNILAPAADVLSPADRRNSQAGIGLSSSSAGTSRDLIFQYVSANFRARMQLLENNNRVTDLTTPLLLTANNEVSRIFIGETVPITTGFTSNQIVAGGVVNTTVSGTPIVELRDVGQSLLITPNINADRTVTLRIAQENSKINPGGGMIPVPTNGATGFTNVPVDTVQRATVSGTVVAKDGLAVALGGLIDESLNDNRSEIPILGKIPVIGFFFRSQMTNRSRHELVIMIRPYVFNTPAESAALSHDLVQDLSLHPNAPDAIGTLNSFSPWEVMRADPPLCPAQNTFRFHSLVPKRF